MEIREMMFAQLLLFNKEKGIVIDNEAWLYFLNDFEYN
jgi:hypothetical protein